MRDHKFFPIDDNGVSERSVRLEDSSSLKTGLFFAGDGQPGFHLDRESLQELVRIVQDHLDETRPKLPTLPHAVIRAKDGVGETHTLSLVVDADDTPWRNSNYWFDSKDIVSFEVLFEGVED